MKITSLLGIATIIAFTGCANENRNRQVIVSDQPSVSATQQQPILVNPRGKVITTLPRGHKTTMYQGNTYYHSRGVYYADAPGGYRVVERPEETLNLIPN